MANVWGQSEDTLDKDYSAELPRIPALSPEQSRQQFELLEGFEIKLVACEPLVQDPVAMAFDARGQLWVVEMCDYSEQDKERLGKVAVLRDQDGDGVMDTRSTFVSGLSWPTALIPWLDGVIVADAPNLSFYRDLDGDLVSDKVELLFVGFGRTNVQGLVNSLRWGVDGWIHGATSSSGAELQDSQGNKISLGRRDFGLDPITGKLRAESGGGQHGMYFNRWGDKFVTSNSDHLQQIIDIESWLGQNSSAVTIPAVRKSIAEDGPQAEVYRISPVEPWRIVRTRLRINGVTPGVVEGGGRAAGYFTGATGTCVLEPARGFGLEGEEHDTAIVCDVGSNLVHRKRLVDQGFFYTGQRLDRETELLRSKDIWFRPVQIGEGPDGALYIADMYREVIEHPASLPPMIKKHLDLTSGRDRGRIWRLVRKEQATKSIPALATLDALQVVQRLGSDVASERLLASQNLLERFVLKQLDPQAIQSIQQASLSAERPEARLLSLSLLARMNQLDTTTIKQALQDQHPRVLAHALELASDHLRGSQSVPQLRSIAQRWQDQRVTLALAKVASLLPESERTMLLTELLGKSYDPLVRAVIASAAGAGSWKLAATAASMEISDIEYANWLALWLPQWSAQATEDPGLAAFIKQSLQSNHSRQAAWYNALSQVGTATQVQKLIQFLNVQSDIDRVISERLQTTPSVEAASWLRLSSPELQLKWAEVLIDKATAEDAQAACIDSLNWSNHPHTMDLLVDNFAAMTPSLQRVALRAMTSRADRGKQLLAALQDQKIARSQIPADVRQTLITLKDKDLAGQFKSVLTQVSADRAAILEKYSQFLDQQQSDSQTKFRGKEVFTRVCAQCHKLGDVGNDVGPPLKQLSDKSPAQLLEAILDPSREVDPKYMGYTFLMDSGTVINGIILQENGQQITVAEAGGKQTTLDRAAIEELKSSGLSLMPNGLEEQITPAQMVDLIQFLKSPY